MQLYLVRHGQSEFLVKSQPGQIRTADDPLTEIGVSQAHKLVDFFKSLDHLPDLIVSSPYLRSRQTADILSNGLLIKLEFDQSLIEFDIGDWRGQPQKDVEAKFEAISPELRYNFRPTNGESWMDEATRFKNVIDKLQNLNINATIIISHEAPIRAVVSLLTNQPPETWSQYTLYETGSVTLLEGGGDNWRLNFSSKTDF